MGLDMYSKTLPEAPNEDVDFEDNGKELFRWRGHWNLHSWMENLYREKGGDEVFNLATVTLTACDLETLEQDLPQEVAFIAAARKAIASGLTVYCTSWC